MNSPELVTAELPVFDRKFWDGTFRFTRIGNGAIGGKASGLVLMSDLLATQLPELGMPAGIEISVPTLAVVATDFFDEFLEQNRLLDLAYDSMSDDRIGYAFQTAQLPVELLGDLRALSEQVKTPLAIRSSSLLEDRLGRPFAGVYATKMIPNNQMDADSRFRKLVEAIKCVYASTFFREAREYIQTTGGAAKDEKMAVIIQEIVGLRHGDRFYPDLSGVARSYNYYPMAPALPEHGVVSLALGLGKTIVDGDYTWTYSPEFPKVSPPFGTMNELMEGTQTGFWAVNMGKPPAYDPISETEYMVHPDIGAAETDEVLWPLVSTFDPERDRVVPGMNVSGPRIVNFAPLLVHEQLPVNYVIRTLMRATENALNQKVEIEFAMTIQPLQGGARRLRLGFLQVRPIMISQATVTITDDDLRDPAVIIASDRALGNGVVDDVRDIVFVRPDTFAPENTPAIAQEIGEINKNLRQEGRPYLLIGFGRWGSSHPSLGIPVDWSQISGAKAIVESTLPNMNVELSQGSHFFHNLSSFEAKYFMLRYDGPYQVNWEWLNRQPLRREMTHLRHVQVREPLIIRMDGRRSRGIIRTRVNEATQA